MAHRMSQTSLSNLSGAMVTQYRDDRLKVVKPPSVRRELVVLRHVFEVAGAELGSAAQGEPGQPDTTTAGCPSKGAPFAGGDQDQLYSAIGKRSAWYLRRFLVLLVETGMRRGELLSIRWRDVDFASRTVLILKTKNGHPRRIPLTPNALKT